MKTKKVGLGFDLRLNPDLQRENPSQRNQRLVLNLQDPISADPNVWLSPKEIEKVWEGVLPAFSNPLHLAKSLDMLRIACRKRGIAIEGLFPVCLTTYHTNLLALIERYGPGYFEDRPEEEELLAQGWQFRGFDVVDLDGLISGLKGCGYAEATWSQLRDSFGSSLNDVGLFQDSLDASVFAELRGLEIREHAPFVVVGIMTHDPVA